MGELDSAIVRKVEREGEDEEDHSRRVAREGGMQPSDDLARIRDMFDGLRA